MITIPINFFNTTAAPGPTGPTGPYVVPTNGLLLYVDATNPASYPGTGTIVYDLSPNGYTGLATGMSYGLDVTNVPIGFGFTASTSSNLIFSNLSPWAGFSETWSYIFWLWPNVNTTSYFADASNNANDRLSLVYGYDSEKARPWNGSYHGIDAVDAPIGEFTMLAFCKDTNGVANNYKSYRNGALQQQISSDFSVLVENAFTFNSSFEPTDWWLFRALVYNRALTSQEIQDMSNGLYDPDVWLYIKEITDAGGSLSTAEKLAVNQMVCSLKNKGIWERLGYIYPFVGGSEESCRVNLKIPSVTGTFYGGSFSNQGYTTNGSSYFNTNIPVQGSNTSRFYYRYVNDPGTLTCGYDGSSQPAGSPYVSLGACTQLEWFDGGVAVSLGGVVGTGYAQATNRTSSSNTELWRELTAGGGTPMSIYATSSANASGVNNTNTEYYIGKLGSVGFGNNNTTGLFAFGSHLTSNQMVQDFHTIVTTFCTTLGRNY
jgi:hypothetical protein